MHGPTFAGNPLACAAANASLDLFEREPRVDQAVAIGTQLRDGLESCRRLAGVRDVRVLGAIGAVQLERAPARLEALRRRFVDHGVWIRPFGDVIYLMPSLVIEPGDLAALLAAIPRVLEICRAANEF
jgi:adenosylmethionine-8-amino-7-oxononanoate aminotransferase